MQAPSSTHRHMLNSFLKAATWMMLLQQECRRVSAEPAAKDREKRQEEKDGAPAGPPFPLKELSGGVCRPFFNTPGHHMRGAPPVPAPLPPGEGVTSRPARGGTRMDKRTKGSVT